MKRTVMLTAGLMLAGMTALGLANENMNSGASVPSVESKPAASTAPAEAKPAANVESAKPVASNSKSEVLPSKEGMPAQHAAPASPAVTGKTDKKETAAVTTTTHAQDKKAEQKPNETQTTTNPTK